MRANISLAVYVNDPYVFCKYNETHKPARLDTARAGLWGLVAAYDVVCSVFRISLPSFS